MWGAVVRDVSFLGLGCRNMRASGDLTGIDVKDGRRRVERLSPGLRDGGLEPPLKEGMATSVGDRGSRDSGWQGAALTPTQDPALSRYP